MHINELHTFQAVAQLQSFSAAAAQLHITQPAVTRRIQSLEKKFGVRLFERVGKQVLVTDAGTVLARQAQLMLSLLDDTHHQINRLGEGVSGRLSLATSHHIGLHRLAPVLKEFAQTYPDVQLDIVFEDSEVAHAMVKSSQIELAVVTLNPQGDPDLEHVSIWHDRLRFVNAVPLADRTMEEIAQQPCVLPGAGTYTGRIVMQRFADAGIRLSPVMSTNYLETIGMLVSVGLGWSVLPESMLSILATKPGSKNRADTDSANKLVEIEVACEEMSRELGYIRHPKRTLSRAAEAFLDVLTKQRT